MRATRLLGLLSLGSTLLACGGASDDTPAPASTAAGAHGGAGGAMATSGGGAGGSTGGAGGMGPAVGMDATVSAFDKEPVYFAGDDNKRQVDKPASFPKEGLYSSIVLHLALSCPKGGCDPWDRFGTLGVVTAKGENGAPDTVIEIARFITPYHVGASWDLDVTDLRPLLTGDLTLRAFIDTWVGPGSQYGGGWALTASFEMKGGIPAKEAIAVVPVWSPRNVVYGDPKKPLTDSLPATTLVTPVASSYALRTFVTGHGQGNAGNCAEFCPKTHTLSVGSKEFPKKVWRTDCAKTAAPGQQGTYTLSRAGWCPGADVKPWTVDVTDAMAPMGMTTFAYAVQDYENTCRPDAMTCAGCTLGTGCDYDGGAHTEPNYAISTVLVAYR